MTESPFLPDGRQWAWNSTSLEPAKACARKYYYQVVLGLRSRSRSVDLEFGKHYATALELYHKFRADNWDHDDALAEVVRTTISNTWEDDRPWETYNNNKNRFTLIRSIVWYLEEYHNDPCKTVILADGTPAVELAFKFKLTDEIWLAGHLDRIVEYAGDYYVQDQKTTGASMGSYYFKRYSPNNQMSLYTIAAEVIWSNPVRGVMIDAAQIAVGFTRFERGFSFRTKAQSEEWLRDTQYAIERIWEAERHGWPMNDSACMMYGGCEFREVCSKDPHVRKEFLATGFEERRYSPLEVR